MRQLLHYTSTRDAVCRETKRKPTKYVISGVEAKVTDKQGQMFI